MFKLYNKSFSTLLGTLNQVEEAFVEEERNGLFELRFTILNTDSLFSKIEKENIVVANANDTLINQKFRIYNIRKMMNNRVEIHARHISFDLMYDYIDNFQCTNQSCQYVLNQLFLNSNFSKNYKGYSDIVNAQNYKITMANVLEAIGGKSGSVLDTFGTGAELLRDNENIHILNRRGNDNLVAIEYRKNLKGFELEEDTTDLGTRILPYAKYNDEATSNEIIVKANYVDSPLIANYSHPYIKSIDYSEKFEDGVVPTTAKLITYAQNEYKNNKVDIPKQNFKIDFIPLSKCVGYEGLNDKISLCDTVTIIDTRYNINTKAKVIKTVFNVLKNRYESIELGEPRTSLGDIIGGGGNEGPIVGPPGPQGPPGVDGNLGNFPDSLPATPILESYVYGFSTIELSWSFENKVYYSYELYASKTKDFVPNAFDKILEGQASSYLFQAKPNETWYFKVCGVNSYGKRTSFSNQATATTTKVSDLSNYVQNASIGDALIGTLRLDRGWIGRLNANVLDVKGNFSVTDGNGVRTFDIDSFGNVNINGYATFRALNTPGQTTIVGDNITSGTITGVTIKSQKDGERCELWGNGVRFFSPTMQAGRICYDSLGDTSNGDSRERFLIESWNEYAMKIKSAKDISIEAKKGNMIYLQNDTRIDGNLSCVNLYTASGNVEAFYDMLYFPQVSSWRYATAMKIGGIRLQGLSSLHLTDETGSNSATLFCENTNFSHSYSLNATMDIIEEENAIDKIDRLDIENTENGYRIKGENNIYRTLENSSITSVVVDEKENKATCNVDTFATISTLCKAVQELKKEIEILKGGA